VYCPLFFSFPCFLFYFLIFPLYCYAPYGMFWDVWVPFLHKLYYKKWNLKIIQSLIYGLFSEKKLSMKLLLFTETFENTRETYRINFKQHVSNGFKIFTLSFIFKVLTFSNNETYNFIKTLKNIVKSFKNATFDVMIYYN
jgi:hypothetical protein